MYYLLFSGKKAVIWQAEALPPPGSFVVSEYESFDLPDNMCIHVHVCVRGKWGT